MQYCNMQYLKLATHTRTHIRIHAAHSTTWQREKKTFIKVFRQLQMISVLTTPKTNQNKNVLHSTTAANHKHTYARIFTYTYIHTRLKLVSRCIFIWRHTYIYGILVVLY